jgi:hypothetical protein
MVKPGSKIALIGEQLLLVYLLSRSEFSPSPGLKKWGHSAKVGTQP